MRARLQAILTEFEAIPGVADAVQTPLTIEFSVAPHPRPTPLRNQSAVYLFFRGEQWLRIGQTNFSTRFTSQHYGTKRAGSSFAKDVWLNRADFGYDGVEDDLPAWIPANFGRANIRLPNQQSDRLSRLLEAFLHFKLAPRFEGKR